MATPKEFALVPIEDLRKGLRRLKFDVYQKLSEEEFTLLLRAGMDLDHAKLTDLIYKGVRELWVDTKDRTALQRYLAVTPRSVLLDLSTSPAERMEAVRDLVDCYQEAVFTALRVPLEARAPYSRSLGNYVQFLASNDRTRALVESMVLHSDYLFHHAVAVTLISLIIGTATGKFNRRVLDVVGLGAFLHDLGETRIDPKILMSPGELTPAQWKEIRSHTKYGLQLLQGITMIPDEVKFVIYQHHEEPSGNGYPNGLKGGLIYFPAKVVCLADAFGALISSRPFRAPYTVEQAVHILQADTGKFDSALLETLGHLFLRSSAMAA